MISESNPNPYEQEKGCGQHLREAREAAGLAVDEVATRLRMPIQVVRSLEQEDWQRLGAPVFVRGHDAWAEGVGERLVAIELPPAWYVLASPGVHAATAGLFQAPDLTRNAAPAKIADFLSGTAFGNAFEPVLRRREPAVEALFAVLSRIGTPRLTGTGSGCFVEFADRESAEDALAMLSSGTLPSGIDAWLAGGAGRSPLLDAVERFNVGASPSG